MSSIPIRPHDWLTRIATKSGRRFTQKQLNRIGFDPTNHLIAHGRHIRVAIGRDYADVPPAKGVFRGDADSELDVGVQVTLAERPEPEEELIPTTGWVPPEDVSDEQKQMQMQQQQQ